MAKVIVLVVSCDRYADVWKPFFALFWRHWSDCPYPVYLGANRQTFTHPAVKTVLTNGDTSWADSTRKMVEQIDSPYILMVLEDFFLRCSVDTERIDRLVSALDALEGGYLRLKPFPKPDRPVALYPEIGEIEREAPYRAALQAAIWKKDTLLRLLFDGETAWDFENLSSWRSNGLDVGFYCTWTQALVYYPAITYGEWTPRGVRICQEEQLPCDLSRRRIMNHKEAASFYRRVAVGSLMNRVPWKWRRRVGTLLRAMHVIKQPAYRGIDYRRLV